MYLSGPKDIGRLSIASSLPFQLIEEYLANVVLLVTVTPAASTATRTQTATATQIATTNVYSTATGW